MSILNTKYKRTGLAGTIIFHAAILLLVVFFGYTTPLPLPAEEGILINFGDEDQGMGQVEPKIMETTQEQAAQQESKEAVEEPVEEKQMEI